MKGLLNLLAVFLIFCLIVGIASAASPDPVDGKSVQGANESTFRNDIRQTVDAEIGYPLMHFTQAQLDEMQNQIDASPKYTVPNRLFQLTLLPGSKNLLPYISYDASTRSQGSCGNCWVWASTGALEIDHTAKTNKNDRLSIQYFNSKYNDGLGSRWACCGGTLDWFTNWYNSDKTPIPWSNMNAYFGDAGSICTNYATAVPFSTISTLPSYQLNSISNSEIVTYNVGQADAINNIKSALDENKGVVYSFWYNGSGWSRFSNFWGNNGETAIFDPDPNNGESGDLPGHSVLIVGYDDTDPNNQYWLVLNSWGAPTNRPHGLFRLKMNMNYSALSKVGNRLHFFQILDSSFKTTPTLAPVASFTTDKGNKMAIAPFTVQFTDTSTNNPTSWLWNWGDGTTDNSTVQNPVHTFTKGGKFSINLTATNNYGSNKSPNTVISVHTRPYNLQITPDIPSGTAYVPHTIILTGSADVYDGTLHYNWLIDGAGTTNTNPISVTFNAAGAGSHTVDMKVIGTYGSAQKSITYVLLDAPTPSITVTSPNGGETWQRGTSHVVTWTSSGDMGSNVKIEVLKAGSIVQTLSSSTPNDGSYSWTIGTGLATGSNYRIRITSTTNPAITDSSNADFNIMRASEPTITVTSPKGGETWQRGTSHAVTWTSSGDVGSNVKIEVTKAGGVVQTLSSSDQNDGTFSWTISTALAAGTDYRILITSTTNPGIIGHSNADFTITPTTTPTITVTSPNGGESWKRGTSHTVTWSSTGSLGSSVNIAIFKSNSFQKYIASNVPIGSGGSGSYTWQIPAGTATGSNYKIGVQSASQTDIYDLSNNAFAITS